MNIALMVILGIVIAVVGIAILVEVLHFIFTLVISVALIIIIVGGAYLILRNILRG